MTLGARFFYYIKLKAALVFSAAAVDRCTSCAYVGGFSSDPDISSALSAAGSSFGADSRCLSFPTTTTSCDASKKCVHAFATFTAKSSEYDF